MEFSSSRLRISVVTLIAGSVCEELDVTHAGSDIGIVFNPSFLTEVLQRMSSDRVVLEMDGPLDPALLRQDSDDDYACIVLPMRVI